MDQSISGQLRKALDFIKSGKSNDARKILVDILKREPEVEQAWYMLSFTVPSEERQIYALKQALRINPSNTKASSRLAKLSGEVFKVPEPGSDVKRRDLFAENPEPISRVGLAESPFLEEGAEDGDSRGVRDKKGPFVEGGDSEDDLITQRLFGGGDTEDEDLSIGNISDQDSSIDLDTRADKKRKKKEKKEEKKRKWKADKLPLEKKGLSRRAKLLTMILIVVIGLYSLDQNGIVDILPDNGDVSGVSSLMTATPPPTDESAAAATEEPTGEASAEATIEPTLVATATTIPPTETATQAPTATSTEIPVENTATPTLTPTQTVVPTAVPTLVAPVLPDEVAAGIQKMQARIDSIRRLKSINAPVSFQVSDPEVRQILERSLSASEISIWAENEKQVYNFIGLSGHSYNLRNHYFNYWAEPQGGFYNPLTNGIYFTGFRFGGAEKYLFAQEYSQTLINKNFNTVELGIFPTCTRGTETCSAIFAMMKGDAMLSTDQWFSRDASSSERKEIAALPEKTFFISTIFPPPFASVDQDFPYVQGKAFVNELYRNGGWTRVNKAYANPPVTTEQILHYDKYVRAEQAVILEPVPLLSLLGSNWSEVKNESLGEWLTYLILAYPENEKAKIDKAAAEKAAAGWGGDLAQVYFNHLENKSVGAFRWVWDTSRDAGEFSSALEEYMKHRYSNNVIDPIAGASCWEGVREVSCLEFSESGSLWVIGTHKALVELVLGEYISGE